jgi:mycothiol synthase
MVHGLVICQLPAKESNMSTAILSENFTTRPATLDDIEPIVALFNTCCIEQIGKPLYKLDNIQTRWQSPSFNMEIDTRVVLAPDGKLVGCVRLWDGAPHVRVFADACVHPEYRGRSIGAYLSQWTEERARQSIAQAPEGARVVLHQNVMSTDTMAQALLLRQGYRLVRHYFNMIIEMDAPPEPAVPEGIIIRPFVREQEARALVHASREAFKDHWGYVEIPFEEDYKEWVHWMDNDPSFDPSLWFVAVDGGEIAGMSLCCNTVAEDPDAGLVEDLCVRRPWRRRGIALALLRHSFGEFYRRGKPKVTLGVDAQSLTGALRLYEKAGMRVQRQRNRYEKELRPGKDLSTQSVED